MATLSTANATETLSGSQELKGVNVTAAGVNLVAEDGALLTLGAGGFTNTAGGVTWGWPTMLGPAASQTINNISTTAQTWYNAEGKTLAITAPLSGGDIFFQGRGRVDVYSTNTISTAYVGASNEKEPGKVKVYVQPGAQLVKEGGTVNCSCAVGGSASEGYLYGVHLMGGTHKYNFIVGTHNNANPSGFFVEAGTTNVIEGSFSTQWANVSSVGIAGHLTIKGGFSHGGANESGGWYPFCNSDTFKNGYLKIADKPATANRVIINKGTLELAAVGNKFNTRGLYVTAGTLKTTVANAFKIADDNKLQLTGSAVWDLTGVDQGVKLFCGSGGTIKSETAAQVHVGNSAYFFDSRLKNGSPASSPALNMGTNVTVCTTVFTGAAGLADDGSLDLYVAAANSSTGTLSVSKGRLVLSAANSAAKFPGTSFTKTQGSWAGRVEVTGGTLVIEHAAALGPKSAVYVSGGSVEIAEGVVLPALALYVADGEGGWTPYRGTCGGAASGAAQQPTLPGGAPVFSGKGTICVGAVLPDGWPTSASFANWVEQGADKLVTTAENWNPSTANVHDGSLFALIAAGSQAKLADNDFSFIQGLAITQPDFTFAPGAGSTLFLGSAGLTNQATGVVWGWPASIGSFEPLWWLAKDSTMELRAPLSGTGTLKIWGGGRLDVYSTNTIQGTVYVGNSNDQSANPVGEVYVYLHPGATLAAKGGTVSIGCRGGWGLHLMGTTLDCNVIAGTQNSTTPAALFVDAGTTNVINGSFKTQFANVSSVGIAGHLTMRGGFEHGGGNPQGVWLPFGNSGTYANGYLKIADTPATANRVKVDRGTLELAAVGNKFNTRGLYVTGGTLKTTVADAFKITDDNKLQLTGSAVWDLTGIDQGVKLFCGSGGTVTSATAAQVHVGNSTYFFDSSFSSGKPASSPALNMGTNVTVCTTVFTDAAGLSDDGTLDLYIAAVNSSTGTLSVTKGKLVMSGYSATATYPGTTIKKSYGAWRAGKVEVTGGTLLVEHKDAFTKDTTLDIAGGTVEVAAGVTARVGELWINGEKQRAGTYGGSESGAKNKLACFTGSGIISVSPGPGLTIFICGGAGAVPSTPSLRFGVLSDVHITRRGSAGDTYSYGSAQTFVHTLQYFKGQNVDAVVLAGDMADRGLPENLQVVADAWKEVFPDDRAADGRHVERVFIYGNHDADKNWFKNASGALSGKTDAEKEALIARSISHNEADAWWAAWGEEWSPAYMKTIKGYRFIASHWGHESQAVDLINEHCFDLAGSKPFFYIQHPQLTDGIYGTYGWNPAAGPTAALGAYPNAITFSGHTHYSTSLEASIYQRDFTSIGTASLSYISKFGGGLNADDSGTTRDGREALLVSVYGNRVVVKRREFVKDADLGPDWVIEPGSIAGGAPYTYAHEQERLVGPEFPSAAAVSAVRTANGLALTLPQAVFDAAHARVPFYDLAFKRGETTVYSCTLQQNGYFAPYDDVPATTSYTLAADMFDASGSFTLEVRARDFYGRVSAPLVTEMPD